MSAPDNKFESSNEEITLEIEGAQVICNRKDLLENSDYFKAMLEGNFKEKYQNVIKLQGIELKVMNIILLLLWDDSYIIEQDDVLMVLEGACMLQFQKIQNICINKLTELLNPKNCIKIWLITEQLSIKPLYLKAKLMSLIEFMTIKDSDCLIELNLNQIVAYLGNCHIKTDNEFIVFQTAMKWWYENSEQFHDKNNVIFTLLTCVNLNEIDENLFKEIQMYPDVVSNDYILNVLNCFKSIEGGGVTLDVFTEDILEKAKILRKVKERVSIESPCILIGNKAKFLNKVLSGDSLIYNSSPSLFVYRDNFKRKKSTNIEGGLTVVYYDNVQKKFKYLLKIDGNKCNLLEGFKIFGYKEYIFMYGGQYQIGTGNWNLNFWSYDFMRERWERKSRIPYKRSHFETCTVDGKIYFLSGMGEYRIWKENMFWYDFKRDVWSKEHHLPLFDRNLKCCCFDGRYFLISLSHKCGYFFAEDDSKDVWRKVDINCDTDYFKNLGAFAVFSYKQRLFIKGKILFELKLVDNKLEIVGEKMISDKDMEVIELVICNELVYTYMKCDYSLYSLEVYNIQSDEVHFIFQNVPVDDIMCYLKICTFQNYNLLENDTAIFSH